MASIYASSTGGNWNATSAWTGGVVPTSADDVFLNSSSGNITLTSGAAARSINCTGYIGTLTHPAAITLTLGDATAGASNIALLFASGMVYAIGDTATSAIVFASTATNQQTIDFGGKVHGNVTWGAGGTPNYALVSALNAGATATMTSTFGHLHMDGTNDNAGLSHTFGKFVASASNVRSIYLGNSTITCNGTGIWWNMGTSANITFDGGTATIIHSDLGASSTGSCTMTIGNKTYYRVRLIGGPEKSISTGNNTVGTIANYERIGPYNNEYGHISGPMPGNGTLKVTSTFKAWGDSGAHRLILWPNNNAIVANLDITGAALDLRYLVVQDMNFIRGADLDLSAITGLSSDAGGNTISGGYTLTFTPAVTQDWVSSGSGNWSNSANWSGGRIPLCQDPVTITKAFSGSPTITLDCCFACGPIDLSASTGTVTLSVSGVSIFNVINGFKGRSGAAISGSMYWNARSGNKNFTFNGSTVVGTQQISSANGGQLTFTDSGTLGTSIAHRSGTVVIPAGVTIATGVYSSSATTSPALSILSGGGTLQVTSTGTVFSGASTAALNDFSGLGKLYVSSTSATAKTITGNGASLPAITFAPNGSGVINITGSNKMPQLPRPNSPGTGSVTLASGSTTTITSPGEDTFYNGANIVSIKAATAGSPAIIVKANGRIRGDYLSLQDVTATGNAPVYAGANSTNVSGNTGITFAQAPQWIPLAA